MQDLAGKTYWLVGASEGLGRALAQQLDAAGARLVLSARTKARLQDLAQTLQHPATVLPVDIANDTSVQTAGAQLPPIDGVILNAGVYSPMVASNWRNGMAVAMANVNLTGVLRVLDQVMPRFVARDSGHIVIVGSLAGFRGLPGAIGYGASKAGVMSLAESLYADLRHTGVRVQLANPGFIKTRLTDQNDFTMPFLMTPEYAACQILNLMQSRRFKHNFPRVFSWAFRASQFMPDWMYYRLFA